jgi:hypothetical protein
VALKAPIPQILLALDGKIDFLKKTNPWGSEEKKKEPAKVPHSEFAAKMHMFLTQKMAAQERKNGGT